MRKVNLSDESGQVLIFAVLSMAVLLGFIALATDVGIFLHERRVMQTAADSAAIAGAAELSYGDSVSAAQQDALQNGIPTKDVAVNSPPLHGPHNGIVSSGSNGYVEVIISEAQPSLFMSLFLPSMNVGARAVATNTPAPTCIYTLNTTGDDVSASGNVQLTVSKCGIIDESSSSPAISTNGNKASITASSIELVSGGTASGNVTPTPTTVSSSSVGDPLLGSVPAPTGYSCSNQPGGTTLGPSSGGVVCYNGLSFSGNNLYTLNPGTYVISGNFSTAGKVQINGTGVTIYMLSGGFSLGGTGTINLSAPNSGAYTNILFYQPSSNTNSISFQGTGGGTLNGIIYAPSATMSLGGTSGGTFNTDLVVGSLTVSGTATINQYVPLSGGPLTNSTLVE